MAPERLLAQGIQPLSFFGEPADEPSVIGWMPAAAVYFRPYARVPRDAQRSISTGVGHRAVVAAARVTSAPSGLARRFAGL